MFRLFGASRVDASVNDTMTEIPLQPMQPGVSFAGHLQVPASSIRTNAPYVTRVERNKERNMVSNGVQQRHPFHMIATGQVESSMAETLNQGYKFNTWLNDGLFEAGYPQNLGISVKLEQVPAALKRGDGPTMQPQPQQRVSIFTRRSFTGSATLPAKPASS